MFKIKLKLAGEELVSFNAPSLPPPDEAGAPAYDAEALAERKRRKRERRERERAAAAAAEAAYGGGGDGGPAPVYLKAKAPRPAAYSGFAASGSDLGAGAGGYKSQLQLLLDQQRNASFGAEPQPPPGGFGAPFGSFAAPAPKSSRKREREQHASWKPPGEALRRAPPPPPRSAGGQDGELKRKRPTPAAPVPYVARVRRPGGPDQPKRHLLEAAVAKLSKVDREGFFQDPVTDAIAPGYSALVARPMDFSAIRNKMRADAYDSWDELSEDVLLIVSNCLLYNAAGTVFTLAAERLREAAEHIIKGYKENGGRPKPAEAKMRMPAPPAPPRQLRPPASSQMQLVPSAPSRPPPAPRPPPGSGQAAPSRPAPPRPTPAAQQRAAPPRLVASALDGRRGLSDDENRRATFRPRGYHSRLMTVHGELALNAHSAASSAAPSAMAPQLGFRPAPGPFAPDGYARSIARFAALLGPRARRLAMQRAAQAVDPLPAKLPVLPAYPAKIQVARPIGAPVTQGR